MKRAILILAVMLAACDGESHSDLKKELSDLSKDLRGKIDPLPVVKPYEPVPYQGAELPDPFGPATNGAAVDDSTTTPVSFSAASPSTATPPSNTYSTRTVSAPPRT